MIGVNMTFARRRSLVVIAAVSALGGASAGAAGARSVRGEPAANHVAPVARRLFRFFSSHVIELQLANRQRKTKITRRMAIGDALRDAPWHHASVTGISLVRYTHRVHRVPAGSLAWLVSLQPRSPIHDSPTVPPANYSAVVIGAIDGRLFAAVDGYSYALGGRPGRSWGTGEFY